MRPYANCAPVSSINTDLGTCKRTDPGQAYYTGTERMEQGSMKREPTTAPQTCKTDSLLHSKKTQVISVQRHIEVEVGLFHENVKNSFSFDYNVKSFYFSTVDALLT